LVLRLDGLCGGADLARSSQRQQQLEGELRAQAAGLVGREDPVRLLGGQLCEQRALQRVFRSVAVNSVRVMRLELSAQLVTGFFAYLGAVANYAIGQSRSQQRLLT
jgi:hypothetical protein